MKKPLLAALLSFNGGFVDTAGFIGLQGLFTAHVTGNFVTLGAALVFGTKGVIAKLIALPEFICVNRRRPIGSERSDFVSASGTSLISGLESLPAVGISHRRREVRSIRR